MEVKVADEVGELKDTIYNAQTERTLDIQIAFVGRFIRESDGGTTQNSSSAYSDYFAVTPGATVSLSGVYLAGTRSIYGYAEDQTPRQNIVSDTSETSVTFTVPDGVHLIRATTTSTGTITGTEMASGGVKFVAKNQGTENAGKVLTVGPDGGVTLTTPLTPLAVDSTLSTSGAAADAKATGDAIEELDTKVAEVKETVIHEETNVLAVETADGIYINSEGSQANASKSAATNYIPVTGGAEITLEGVVLNSARYIFAYAKNDGTEEKEQLAGGQEVQDTSPKTFTATLPEWANYVRASTNAGVTITGSERIITNYVSKASTNAEEAKQLAEKVAQDIPDAVSKAMLSAYFRADLPKPTGLSLDTSLNDAGVYFTAVDYRVTAKPEDYKNTITTALYIDAVNGDDENAGTEAAPKKTIQGAVAAGVDTVYLQNGTYTFPDSSSISQDINMIGLGEDVIISGGITFSGDHRFYVENITFDGGGHSCFVQNTLLEDTPEFCAYKCTFQNSTAGNGLSIRGEIKTRVFNCLARNNYHDGFNYHKIEINDINTKAPNVLEYNCEAYGNGATDNSHTSDNGTTAHNYTQIIRVNGNYHHNHGGNIADKGNVKAWTVHCSASASQKTVGDVNNADFWIESNTIMYCDNCYASGSTFDGWARLTSTLYVAGGNIVNMYTDDGSSKQLYTSEAVFKYRMG